MAWIEVHQALRDHRKVLALADRLDLIEPYVVGHLVFLWSWALDNAPHGVLPHSERIIAKAAGWTGDPHAFVAALIACGFIDDRKEETRTIHDFEEYVGKLIDRREANAEKQRAWRNRQKHDPDPTPLQLHNRHVTVTNTKTLPQRDGATVPNPTQPNRTQPDDDDARTREVYAGAYDTTPSTSSPPPSAINFSVDDKLVTRVEVAANLCSEGMRAIVLDYAPRLAAMGKDIVTEATCWREKYEGQGKTQTAAAFKSWCDRELTRAPPPPASITHRSNGHDPTAYDKDATERSLARYRRK